MNEYKNGCIAIRFMQYAINGRMSFFEMYTVEMKIQPTTKAIPLICACRKLNRQKYCLFTLHICSIR